MKNTINCIIVCMLSIIGLVGFLGICEGQRVTFGGGGLDTGMTYIDSKENDLPTCNSTNIGDCVSIKEQTKKDTIIIRLLGVFGLDTDRANDHKFIDYARAIINMALGLVAFIALIMSIYTFYMMFFSENDAGIKKAKGNLVGIFIALAILGLAWIIVSFIFRWYQSNWKDEEKNLFPESSTSFNYYDKTIKNQIYLTI